MNSSPIPILIPQVPTFPDFQKYLLKIDQGKIYSNFGPLSIELGGTLASYFGVEEWQIQTVANATLGLQGALMTAEDSRQLNWGIPSWTFTATASACEMSRVSYEFLDIDENWCVQEAEGFNAVLDVLPFGDEMQLSRFSKKVKRIVVDAAASFDSLKAIQLPTDIPVGIIVSLHATKLIAAGEGGIFITNDRSWSEKFRAWTSFGMEGSRTSKFVGTNAKMSEYACAVALASFHSWPEEREQILIRNSLALRMSEKCTLGVSPAMKKGFATPYWIAKFVDAEAKNRAVRAFEQNQIQTRDWWLDGCHTMPAYLHVPRHELTKTEQMARTTLGLPFHSQLSEDDWSRIDQTLKAIA